MRNSYPELAEIMALSNTQKTIYKPTSFWEKAARDIISEIEISGVENFRSLQVPQGYFVPNYGIPANAFTKNVAEAISATVADIGTPKQALATEEFLSGYLHALSDYRVFMAADNRNKKPFLDSFSESQYGNPVEQFTFNESKYSRSSLNYILGLCFIKQNIEDTEQIKTVLEIGGGFGTLGEILSYTDGMKYINVDIPPMSFIAWQYLSNIYDESKIGHCVHETRTHQINKLPPCNVFNSWDIENIEGDIDLFVNFISFQEMEPNIVENYLRQIKRLRPKFILLRNIREGKQVKKHPDDVGVETPILKDDYINMIKDTHPLIASSVIPYGYKTVDGFHSELLLFGSIHE